MTLSTGLLAYLLTLSIIDAWLFDLGVWGRSLAAIVLLVALSVYVLLRIVPLLIGKINPLYAARMIESSGDTFKNSLINSLSLRQGDDGVNAAVMGAVESDAAHRLSQLPIENAVDRSRLIKIGYLMAGVLILCAAYKILSPKDPIPTLARIAAPLADISRPSRVRITEVTPGDTLVFYGETLEVKVRVRGVADSERVTLFYSTADGQSVAAAIPMKPDDSSFYQTADLRTGRDGIEQALEYWVAAGDTESRRYQVEVRTRPSISIDRLEFDLPAYTDLPDFVVEQKGDITALEGTRVKVHIVSNLPLNSARIELLNSLSDNNEPGNSSESRGGVQEFRKVRTVTMQTDELKASGEFVLELKSDRTTPKFSHYQIRILTEEDQRNDDRSRYQVKVLPDLAPDIAWVRPDDSPVSVPVNGELQMEIAASDPDFQLSGVYLFGENKGTQLFRLPLLDKQSANADTQPIQFSFRPGDHGLSAGDEIVCFAIAEDNRTSPLNSLPDPNASRSENRIIQITKRSERPSNQPDKESTNESSNETRSDSTSTDEQNKENSRDQNSSSEQGGDNQKSSQSNEDEGESSEGEADENDQTGSTTSENSETKRGDSVQPDGGGTSSDENSQNQSDESSNSNENASRDAGTTPQDQNDTQSDDSRDPNQNGDVDPSSDSPQPQDRDAQGTPNENTDGDRSTGNEEVTGTPQGTQTSTDQESIPEDLDDDNVQQAEEEVEGELHDGEAFQKIQEHMQQNQPRERPDKSDISNDSASSDQENRNDGSQEDQNNDAMSPSDPKQPDEASGSRSPSDAAQRDPASRQPEPDQSPLDQEQAGGSGATEDAQGGGQSLEESGSSGGAQESPVQESPVQESPEQQSSNGTSESGQAHSPAGSANSDSESTGSDSQDAGVENSQGPASDSPNDDQGNDSDASKGARDQESSETGSPDTPKDSDPDQASERPGSARSESDSSSRDPSADHGAADENDDPGEDPTAADPGGTDPGARQLEPPDGSKGNDPSDGSSEANDPSTEKPERFAPDSRDSNQRSGDSPGAGHQMTDSDQPVDSTRFTGEIPDTEKEKLEYTKQATDLALEYLESQKDEPDSELLDRLNWSKDDLRDFLERWKQMKQSAQTADAGESQAYEDRLRSLGLSPVKDRGSSQDYASDEVRGLQQESARTPPPREFLDQFKAFIKGASRANNQ